MASADPCTRLLVDLIAGRVPRTGEVDWDRTVERLRVLGLEGLAVSVHRSSSYLPPDAAEALEPAYLKTALHTTLTLEAARRALDALERSGVPALLYKGAALVDSGLYTDPGARAMDDADLLVPAARAEDAVRVLRAEGFDPWVEWQPDTVSWLDSATFRDRQAPRGADVDLDLHWRLGYGGLRYGGGKDRDEEGGLWQSVGGTDSVPGDAAHLVVVAEHVLKHFHVRLHLAGVMDLVRLSAALDDWTPVEERLDRHPGGRSLATLLAVVREAFDAPVPEGVTAPANGGVASWILSPETLLERATGEGPRIRGLLYRWLLAGSPRRTAGEVRATVLPGAAWLRARYGDGREDGGTYPIRLLLRYWWEVARWLAGRGVSPVSPNQEFEG